MTIARYGGTLVSWVLAAAVLAFGAGAALAADTVLFIGNSFTYGANSPVWKYRADTVTDLNGGGAGGSGGVPALFKTFTVQSGLDYDVSVEAVGGTGLDFHLSQRTPLIDRAWDHVVMHGYSTLDRARPGDPALLIDSAGKLAKRLHDRNPKVDIRLMATWPRADQVYLPSGHWRGQPIEAMTRDLRRAYDTAAKASPHIAGVVPVGDAWTRAFATGFADPNPFDGIAAGQANLWSWDSYHASSLGYYLEALMVFGQITGRDPTLLGERETAAAELGISPAQAAALQAIARDELLDYRGEVVPGGER